MIRRRMIAIRRAMTIGKRRKANQALSQTLLARTEWNKVKTICLYVSLPDEVDTSTLLRVCIDQKKTVVVPRIVGKELMLHRIRTLRDLKTGSFGISEPKASCPVIDKTVVDLFIVPGIAFDRKGYRLGWGKGYYDRLLADVKVPKIGFAYSCQLLPRLPHSSYDIPMDVVITEKEIVDLRL